MLTLKAFGPLDVRDASGRSLTALLSQSKRAALLTYLVLCHPEELYRRDHLLGLFWPELDQKHGRNALSQALSFLRRKLGRGVLITRGADEVGVDLARITSDVRSFEAAITRRDWAAALQVYTGDLLEGLHAVGASPFVDWVDRERERLREAAARAAWQHGHERIAAGNLTAAERAAQRALMLVPTDESPVRAFIQALAGAGDRAAALRFYEKFAAVLAQELEVEPAPETVAVMEAARARSEPVATRIAPVGDEGGASPIGYAPPRVRDTGDTVGEGGAPPADSPTFRRRRGKTRAAAVAAFLAILGSGAVYSSLTRSRGPSQVDDLVVVPPFENRTGNPEMDEVAVLAAFWVEEALQQVQDVQLVPSSFAGRFAWGEDGASDPVRAMAEATNAGWAVRGAIRGMADSLEFRVEVIDLSSSRREQHVVEAGPRDSMAALLDRVARRVSGALAYEFDPMMKEWEGGGQPLSHPPTIEAFRENRLGYQAFEQGDFAASYRHHLAAYALDSTLVRALVSAAYATADYRLMDSLAQFASERRHLLSRRGQLDLDILCALLTRDHQRALRAIRETARLEGPGLSSVLEAWFAMRVNLPAEGLAATERYDPSPEWRRNESHYYWRYRSEALHMLGRYQDELTEARDGRQRFPTRLDLLIAEVRALAALGREQEISDRLHEARSLPSYHDSVAVMAAVELRAHGHMAASTEVSERAAGWLKESLRENGGDATNRLYLARALYGLEQWRDARAVVEDLLVDQPDNLAAVGMVGLTAARLGDSITAGKALDRLSGMAQPYRAGEHLYQMACISAVLGRPDEAMRLLYQAFREGLPHGLRLHQDMDLESLRTRDDYRSLATPKG